MSQLADLEEKIHQVKNKSLVPGLSEAIRCYYASSYRACVLLSFNALVDDLLDKIRYLKDVNENAKVVYQNVSNLISKQQSFETPLVDQLVKYEFFSDLDGELYKIFQQLRHKSAHSSGFAPSAECARFVFTEVINRFLSKESLKTTERIDVLLQNIPEKGFFPGTTSIAESARVVRSEISDIHPEAYPQLIDRLYKKYSENKEICYVTFICALLKIGDGVINNLIINKVVKPHAHKEGNDLLMVSLISTHPSLFSDLDEVYSKRLVRSIVTRIKMTSDSLPDTKLSNPYQSILQICNKTVGPLREGMVDLMGNFIKNQKRLCYFIKQVNKSEVKGNKEYLRLYELILAELACEDESRITTMITTMMDDTSEAFAELHGSRSLKVIITILRQKQACAAIDELKKKNFEPLGKMVEKARAYYHNPENNKTVQKIGKNMRTQLDIHLPADVATANDDDAEAGQL